MAALHLQAVVAGDGTLTLRGLPSLAGRLVDVVVRDAAGPQPQSAQYPLRGRPLRYERPFDSVAETDWEAGQ